MDAKITEKKFAIELTFTDADAEILHRALNGLYREIKEEEKTLLDRDAALKDCITKKYLVRELRNIFADAVHTTYCGKDI